jgi:hypothetical protein
LEFLGKCLGDQQTVEGVFVVKGQPDHPRRVHRIDRKDDKPVFVHARFDEVFVGLM